MIPGTNTLLMGAPGTGKTHSIRTLVDAGLEVFVLFTEPGMEVLGDTDPDKVHWHYVPPADVGFDTFIKNAKAVNQFDAAALQKIKASASMAPARAGASSSDRVDRWRGERHTVAHR